MCDQNTVKFGMVSALVSVVIIIGYLLFDKDQNIGMYTLFAGLFFAFIVITTGMVQMDRKRK